MFSMVKKKKKVEITIEYVAIVTLCLPICVVLFFSFFSIENYTVAAISVYGGQNLKHQ